MVNHQNKGCRARAIGFFLGLGMGRSAVSEIRPRQRSKVASVAANRIAASPPWITIQRIVPHITAIVLSLPGSRWRWRDGDRSEYRAIQWASHHQ